MAINLTLNDFRGVLGIKNDGDVAMKLDRSGIEKVNWGGFFRNLFFKVRKVPSNPVENAQMRQALLMAISNSSEGKVLTEEQRKILADYQRAVLDNGTANDVVANDLNNLLITPLATAYNEYAAQHDLLAKVSEE